MVENASTGNDHLSGRDDGLPSVAALVIPNPSMVNHNMVRLKKAESLRRDAAKIYDAARIARHHNLPHLDNALTAFANKLNQDSRDVRSQIKTVQNVELATENKSKL